MRAAILEAYETPLVIDEVEAVSPGDDRVVVDVVASGICHTDVSVIDRKIPYRPPIVLGHEGAGIVRTVGAAVRHVSPGDRVVLAGVVGCGHCPWCREGRLHLCPRGIEMARDGSNQSFERGDGTVGAFLGLGTFAERATVRGTQVIRVPDDTPLERACLVGCAVITGVGAVINTAGVRPGQSVAVLGCGGIGLNVIQGAVLAGATTIIAVDVRTEKLEHARAFGATAVLDGNEPDLVVDAIRDATGGLGVHVAFEAAGVPELLRTALRCVRRGGTAVAVGIPPFRSEVSLPASLFALEERSLVGSLYGSGIMSRDIPRLVSLAAQGALDLDGLVSHEIALDDINDAIDAMRRGEGLRTVIRYDR